MSFHADGEIFVRLVANRYCTCPFIPDRYTVGVSDFLNRFSTVYFFGDQGQPASTTDFRSTLKKSSQLSATSNTDWSSAFIISWCEHAIYLRKRRMPCSPVILMTHNHTHNYTCNTRNPTHSFPDRLGGIFLHQWGGILGQLNTQDTHTQWRKNTANNKHTVTNN